MKPVLFHSGAREELDEAVAFYERQRPGLGLDLLSAVDRSIGAIQRNPQIGAPY